VKPSTIVTIMFICSIFSSWLFIVSILSLIFSLESFRTKLKYLKYYNSIDTQYNEVRKSHNSISWGSKIFLLGLLFL
jgi:biopolymer transport protein ExbB/TolQ